MAEKTGNEMQAPAAAKAVASKAPAPAVKATPAKQVQTPAAVAASPSSVRVIQFPIATEKAVSGIETRNEITLIVSKNATKKQVLAEAEKMFGAKVVKVRTSIFAGRKKAIVKFAKAGTASDVAAKLKIV